jgi:hypothetical protein
MKSICFQTTCYEKDYSLLLEKGLLENYLSHFPEISFSEKRILINNVKNPKKIDKLINSKFPEFSYVFTDDQKQNVINYFDLDSKVINVGLYYSIQHFTGVYCTDCDYLFHIGGDNNIEHLDSNFIRESIDILESNDSYIIAMPRWGEDPTKGAIEEAIRSDHNFFVEFGFTDQIYILKVNEFKNKIYNYSHPDSSKYPLYGGELFEKRVNSFMRTMGKYRVVHKNYFYMPGYYDYLIKKSNKLNYLQRVAQKVINVQKRFFK